MPGRKFTAATSYRYGFNGKELDNEFIQYDYGFRIYDPRLGCFKSVDPLAASYPWNSTYAFAENDVIRSIDLDGLEKYVVVNNYDKYGRVIKIRVESIVTVGNKQAIDQNFKIRNNNKDLTDKDIYVQHLRDRQFIANDGSRNGSLTPQELLAYNTTIKSGNRNQNFDADNSILNGEDGALGNEFNTSNSKSAFSYIAGSKEGVTHDYKDGERGFSTSTPIQGKDKIFADWVSGSIQANNSGISGTAFGLSIDNTTRILSNTINDYVKTFKANNKANVAFVDKITLTLNNNKEIKSWNQVAARLRKTYNAQVIIKIDAGIEQRNQNTSATTGSGTYADVQYNVSGVKDGDKTKASKGSQ